MLEFDEVYTRGGPKDMVQKSNQKNFVLIFIFFTLIFSATVCFAGAWGPIYSCYIDKFIDEHHLFVVSIPFFVFLIILYKRKISSSLLVKLILALFFFTLACLYFVNSNFTFCDVYMFGHHEDYIEWVNTR